MKIFSTLFIFIIVWPFYAEFITVNRAKIKSSVINWFDVHKKIGPQLSQKTYCAVYTEP